jgi:hypothetical protein
MDLETSFELHSELEHLLSRPPWCDSAGTYWKIPAGDALDEQHWDGPYTLSEVRASLQLGDWIFSFGWPRCLCARYERPEPAVNISCSLEDILPRLSLSPGSGSGLAGARQGLRHILLSTALDDASDEQRHLILDALLSILLGHAPKQDSDSATPGHAACRDIEVLRLVAETFSRAAFCTSFRALIVQASATFLRCVPLEAR